MDELSQIIAQYGIYAVFALCTIEGDITLLISGAMAHSGYFGNYSWLKVLFFGTVGGMAGDCVAYGVGRGFHENAKDYRFYHMAQPRIERLIDKFRNFCDRVLEIHLRYSCRNVRILRHRKNALWPFFDPLMP
jgi:membrane protein DedA with SNARE-associated domain